MKSQKNNSLREGQFPRKRSGAASECLPRRGGIIGHMQQLLPLQKHPCVFASTATPQHNTCGTKVTGTNTNMCRSYYFYSFIYFP